MEDKIFTISGIVKEAKRVRWPHWKSDGKDKGIIRNTAEVITFSGLFAIALGLADFAATLLLKKM